MVTMRTAVLKVGKNWYGDMERKYICILILFSLTMKDSFHGFFVGMD